MKKPSEHFARLLFGAAVVSALAAVSLGGSEDPSLKDPAWIAKENKRIHEQYKNDPARLSDELDAFNHRVARALGTDKIFERRKELKRKYGPLGEVTETLPSDPETAVTIDHGAWLFSPENKNNQVTVTFSLDKSRYREAKPTGLKARLRRRGTNDDSVASRWQASNESFAIDLPYRVTSNGTFQVTVMIPPRERSQYVIQVLADIEPGWAVESVFDLK